MGSSSFMVSDCWCQDPAEQARAALEAQAATMRQARSGAASRSASRSTGRQIRGQVERPEALDHINEVSPVPDEAWMLKLTSPHAAHANGYTSLKQARSCRQCRPILYCKKKRTTMNHRASTIPLFPIRICRFGRRQRRSATMCCDVL